MSNLVNEDLLREMFDEVEVSYGRDGTATDVYVYSDPEDFYVDEETFNATKEYLEQLIYNAKFYDDGRRVYIELSDNHTLWDINGENFDDEYYAESYYTELVNEAAQNFEIETGVRPLLLGRSGRHVCVEYTLKNLENYDFLVRTQRALEEGVIDEMNNYDGGEW